MLHKFDGLLLFWSERRSAALTKPFYLKLQDETKHNKEKSKMEKRTDSSKLTCLGIKCADILFFQNHLLVGKQFGNNVLTILTLQSKYSSGSTGLLTLNWPWWPWWTALWRILETWSWIGWFFFGTKIKMYLDKIKLSLFDLFSNMDDCILISTKQINRSNLEFIIVKLIKQHG